MPVRIASPRDFWAGLLYCGLGLGACLIARSYQFGSPARMGPGFFPILLGGILAVLGVVSIVRSFVGAGDAIGVFAWKPLALITGATVAFGLVLPVAGSLVALVVLMLGSAAASSRFGFEPKAALGMMAVIAACILVFVKLIGLPMPILGSWLD